MSAHYRKALAAAGAVLAVAVVAVAVYVLHPGARPHAANHHAVAATHAAASGVAASQGAAALPSPSQLPAAAQAPKAPAGPIPAVSASPAAPVPLTACTTMGDTATDGAGNLVQCTGGSGGASLWVCDPLYPNQGAVPGQTVTRNWPLGGNPPVVLDTAGTQFVTPVQQGDGSWIWQVTAPPC